MKIAIVGAGPRGLIMAERLIHNAAEKISEILLFDPFEPGGTVWRSKQADQLIMNSVAQQVTLFTDETCQLKGPIAPGPNLYQWSQNEALSYLKEEHDLAEARSLAPNDYCRRSFYGLYQKWFFEELQKKFPKLRYINAEVMALEVAPLRLMTKAQAYPADAVVIATGNYANELTKDEGKMQDYAEKHSLLYQAPSNAADSDYQKIKAQENVILRGLGLNFFDYVGLFSEGRGGYFAQNDDELIYHASGKEPKLFTGSRSGLPYHVRGVNQKRLGEVQEARFLTSRRLRAFKKGDPKNGQIFFDLMKKEIELSYYQQLLAERGQTEKICKFTQAFCKSLGAKEVLAEFQIPRKNYWDWAEVDKEPKSLAQTDFESYLNAYLEKDIIEGRKGNQTGPFATAVDTLKDLRDPVRYMLEHELFTPDDYIEKMWGEFAGLNEFLTIGPPIRRMQQLRALKKAGIVTFLAPEMVVERKEGKFITYSKKEPQKVYSATALLEARVPANSARHTKNPLIRSLVSQGLTAPHQVVGKKDKLETGAITIERQTNRLLTKEQQVLKNIYCYGIPVEGIDWLTASTCRPQSDEWNLRQADKIARLILGFQD